VTTPAIAQAADDLNAAIGRLEDALVGANLTAEASVVIDNPIGRVSFAGRKLTWSSSASAPPFALTRASLDARIAAAEAMPRLIAAIQDAEKYRLHEIVDAITGLDALAARLTSEKT